jgi:hypothetical protein
VSARGWVNGALPGPLVLGVFGAGVCHANLVKHGILKANIVFIRTVNAESSSPHLRSSAYSVLESAGVVRVAVMRLPALNGDLSQAVWVTYRTEDGDAVAGLDYVVGWNVCVCVWVGRCARAYARVSCATQGQQRQARRPPPRTPTRSLSRRRS